MQEFAVSMDIHRHGSVVFLAHLNRGHCLYSMYKETGQDKQVSIRFGDFYCSLALHWEEMVCLSENTKYSYVVTHVE